MKLSFILLFEKAEREGKRGVIFERARTKRFFD